MGCLTSKRYVDCVFFWAKGKSMTNEVKLNPLNGWGADADTLYHTNMVECHRAFMIGR